MHAENSYCIQMLDTHVWNGSCAFNGTENYIIRLNTYYKNIRKKQHYHVTYLCSTYIAIRSLTQPDVSRIRRTKNRHCYCGNCEEFPTMDCAAHLCVALLYLMLANFNFLRSVFSNNINALPLLIRGTMD